MVKITPWQPLAAPQRAPLLRALDAAVRMALAPAQWADSKRWEHGRRSFPEPSPDATPAAPAQAAHNPSQPPAVVVKEVSWRFLGWDTDNRRQLGHWQYHGHALLAGKRVDFFGEYLRDCSTHAFRAFELFAPDCPATRPP